MLKIREDLYANPDHVMYITTKSTDGDFIEVLVTFVTGLQKTVKVSIQEHTWLLNRLEKADAKG